jgi:hypothetical protein
MPPFVTEKRVASVEYVGMQLIPSRIFNYQVIINSANKNLSKLGAIQIIRGNLWGGGVTGLGH